MTQSIVFAGTPENAATTLRGLVTAGIEVELVLTRPDAPVGRKRIMTPSAVAQAAEELGLPIIKTNKLDSEVIGVLSETRSQLAIVVAFGVILRTEAISSLKLGWFNLHYSVLPQLRGAAPVQHALLNGMQETGVTLFKIDEGLDTGPILSSASAVIEPNDNASSLLNRLTQLGISLLLQELPRLYSAIELNLVTQEGPSSLAPKLTRDLAQIVFSNRAADEFNRIRATNPEPGAWCRVEHESMKILESRLTSDQKLAPGEVDIVNGNACCGFGGGTALELILVQPAGKSAMSATDWLRGRKSKVWLS